MAISDAQYLAWLKQAGQKRVLLAEVQAYVTGTGVVTRYLATRGYVSTPADTPASTTYLGIIMAVPQFRARMGNAFGQAAASGWGDLVLGNIDGEFDAWLDDGWDGRAVTLYFGDASWPKSDFRAVLTGLIADIAAPSRDRLALKLRDKLDALNVPLQKTLVGGSTANANQPKPVALGACFNAPPPCDDTATHRYLVHDAAVNDVTDVRDNGVSVGGGGYTKDNANGRFTLAAAPAGQVTCDVQGAKPSAYLVKCADLVEHVAKTYTAIVAGDIDSTNFSAFNTTCAQTLGLWVGDRANARDVVARLAGAVGADLVTSRAGLLQLVRLAAPSGTADLTLGVGDIVQRGVRLLRRYVPIQTYRLGYKQNHAIQREGLAAGVSEANREAYGAPYLVATDTNAGVTTKYLLAENPDMVPSVLTDATEAATEADRRATLWSVVRHVWEVQCWTAPFQLQLGDIVDVTHPRFGMSGTLKTVLVGLTESPTRRRCTLELFA